MGVAVTEEGEPAVAAEGDEVVVTLGLVTLQAARHVVRVRCCVSFRYTTCGCPLLAEP